MPCPYRQHFAFELSIFTSSALRTLSSVLCTLFLYSTLFLPLRQGEYHEVGRGYDVSFTFRFPFISYPLRLARPNVAMGITVGTRHAVSANEKDDTMGVSDTACRVPTANTLT